MACYAAISSLANLLHDIVHHDRDEESGIGRLANIESLLIKVKSLQGLLQDHSIKASEDVQFKIRDVAYEVQDIIQYQLHHQMITHHILQNGISNDEFIRYLRRFERQIDSLVKNVMEVAEGQTSEEQEYWMGMTFWTNVSLLMSMAFYAYVSWLMNLLDAIVHHDRDKDLGIGRLPNMQSLLLKVKSLQGLLQHHHSIEAAENVQHKTGRELTFFAQYLIEDQLHIQMMTHFLHLMSPKKSNRFILKHQRPRILMECKFWLKESLRYLSSKGKKAAHDHVQSGTEMQNYTVNSSGHHLPPSISNEDFIEYLSIFEHKIGSLVEDMRAIEEGQPSEQSECPHDTSSGPSHAGENSMIGFDDYMLKIKEELCGHSSELEVIPIVGMGGIGKTTLATHVYKDRYIVHEFDFRGWIAISQDYSLERVLHRLMKSLHMEESHEMDKVAIYQYLKGRKYLIVIDDIWSTNAWDDLKQIFTNDRNGSRILLTTRLEEVASYCGTLASHHRIQFLNESESWNLLQKKVFELEHCPQELEDIGKLIAKKCQGLPLAIVVIAGVLSQVKTQHHWKDIERNMVANLIGNDKDFSSVLSLSYNHLPCQLKACFLYIGRFPEDYEIEISRLVNLWIAEGFIELRSMSKSLEEVVEECLQDLVKRSLILVTKRKPGEKFKYCVIHDLLRDFCKKKGLGEQFFHVKNDKKVVNHTSRGVRRINVLGTHSNESNINASLHSIMWFGGNLFGNIFCGFILL